jgi:hypothetical protein
MNRSSRPFFFPLLLLYHLSLLQSQLHVLSSPARESSSSPSSSTVVSPMRPLPSSDSTSPSLTGLSPLLFPFLAPCCLSLLESYPNRMRLSSVPSMTTERSTTSRKTSSPSRSTYLFNPFYLSLVSPSTFLASIFQFLGLGVDPFCLCLLSSPWQLQPDDQGTVVRPKRNFRSFLR